jgi:hypothetical protein
MQKTSRAKRARAFPTRPGRWTALALVLAACAACAPPLRSESAPAPSPPPSAPPEKKTKASSADPTIPPAAAGSAPTVAPMTQQRVARALDPAPGSDPCGGFMFDGVALDMPRSALESSLPLVPLARADSAIEGFEERTYGFRAARPGRIDDVQLGFSEGKPAVMHIHAQILVAETDTWPRTLFDRLGSPKNARIGEWIWWDLRCGATLRLTKIEPLGGGGGIAYTLDVRHTLKPAQ